VETGKDRRHGKDGNTRAHQSLPKLSYQLLTRDGVEERVTMRIGHIGRYFEIKRADLPLETISFKERKGDRDRDAYLVVKTRIAPALSSKLELTAAIAHASTVSAGRGARLRSSSKWLT
jgi:hypothetical protein